MGISMDDIIKYGIKGVQIYETVSRLTSDAEVNLKGKTGAEKKEYVTDVFVAGATAARDLNVIKESQADEIVALITVVSPLIDRVVAINNKYSLWDRIVGFLTRLFGGDEAGPAGTPTSSIETEMGMSG